MIKAEFTLSSGEHAFLLDHAQNIALGLLLLGRGQAFTITGDRPILPQNLSEAETRSIRQESETLAAKILDGLTEGVTFNASVTITTEPDIKVDESAVAYAAFGCFQPESLGEIEFHSSRRWYIREDVTNIRLRIGDRSEERRSRFLFDIENKYRNIKTQLGEEYIASVLRKEDPQDGPLQSSIKELFKIFFPGKTFLGIQLSEDNSMSFPVRLDTGEIHDIDELSSGEKEIVYGYLGLRTGTPRGSIVLVDEPELHLNPALVQGLPSFYKLHLADALDSQVWIVTHSDAILRQAVRSSEMAVYHMARPVGNGVEQAVRIDSQNAVEAAVLDLIGDLAAYRPYAKIVLVEGKETRFDVDMIRRLFPDFAEKGNFLPIGSRRMTTGVRVRLIEVLSEAGLAGRAVSISDSDLELGNPSSDEGEGHYRWPVYEIENFLLVPEVIRAAAMVMLRKWPFSNDSEIADRLRGLAGGLVAELARDEVQHVLNDEFVSAVSVGGSKQNPTETLRASADASKLRVGAIDTSEARIMKLFEEACERLRSRIDSDEFLVKFPGDRLLRALAGSLGLNGDHFRNACLDQAQRLGMRPNGMEQTLKDALG